MQKLSFKITLVGYSETAKTHFLAVIGHLVPPKNKNANQANKYASFALQKRVRVMEIFHRMLKFNFLYTAMVY